MNQSLSKFTAILIKNGFESLLRIPYEEGCAEPSHNPYLFNLIYLGRKQIYKRSFANHLSDNQLLSLQQLGIDAQASCFTYESGLVNISTTSRKPVDIVAFNNNIVRLLESIKTNPDSTFSKSVKDLCESLKYGWFLQTQFPTDLCTNKNYAACYKEVFQEQEAQLAELCTFFIPLTFLSELSEPAHFITTTAKLIGVLLFQTITGDTNGFHHRSRNHHAVV